MKYVVSHRVVFTFTARKIMRAAYEKRFHVSEKQMAELNKWTILQPEQDRRRENKYIATSRANVAKVAYS